VVAASEVVVRQVPGEIHVVRLERGDALQHPEPLVGPVVALQPVGGALELGERLTAHLLAGIELGELEAAGDVLRIQIHHLLQGGEGGLGVTLALVVGDHHLEEGHGLGHEPEVLVQLGELDVDLDQIGVELEDLLVEGDGLQEEAVLRVHLGDAGEE
jgi:hypothetical protein